TWVYGWRLIALVDLTTLIPLAIKVVQIQEHEAPHLLALLEQAQHNLAPHSRIVSLVVDRAYVDGPTLYAIAQQGITWTLLAKSNQVARATAVALSAHASDLRHADAGHGDRLSLVGQSAESSRDASSGFTPGTARAAADSKRPGGPGGGGRAAPVVPCVAGGPGDGALAPGAAPQKP
ncbi:MAG: transposase, partial [Azonexus sp.]|nr:transposase [Azonexus sp.]